MSFCPSTQFGSDEKRELEDISSWLNSAYVEIHLVVLDFAFDKCVVGCFVTDAQPQGAKAHVKVGFLPAGGFILSIGKFCGTVFLRKMLPNSAFFELRLKGSREKNLLKFCSNDLKTKEK